MENLDQKQIEVVTTTEGPLLVFAGAGSGKTRSIIYRAAYLVNELGIPPWKILIVTFTNKAARELKERLSQYFAIDIRSFWVGTFHSICARILRQEADRERLGFDSNFTIFDTEDSLSILRKLYKEIGVSNTQYPIKNVFNIISTTKNSLITTEDFFEIHPENRYSRTIQTIYARYQQKLRENNSLDFDDLMLVTATLLSDNEEIRKRYNDKFGYVMIDEYQDTNYAQFHIVRLLCGERQNICVVGDDDQAIYSWRGATIKNILNFSSDFLNAKIIRLEKNYRSSQQILDRANQLIANNHTRHQKTLWTERKEGEEPQLQIYETDRDEVEGVLTGVSEIMAGERTRNKEDGAGGETVVILYRTNAQSRIFETGCLEHNIPYQIHGSLNFFQRKEIKDIVAYLRVLINPTDSESLFRIINFPPRGIGQTTVNRLVDYASRAGITLYEAMSFAGGISEISRGIAEKIRQFTSLLDRFTLQAKDIEITELVNNLSNAIGFLDYYKNCTDHKDIVRMENITEFFATVKEYAENYYNDTGEKPLLAGFLQSISLWTSSDSTYAENALPSHSCPSPHSCESRKNVLNLMTLHNAKGLEFDNVFIVGLEEKLLPHSLCINSIPEIEEERRLVYVGMTRAKKRLFLSYARFRRTFYGYENCIPSRFIREIFPETVSQRTSRKFKPVPAKHTDSLMNEDGSTNNFKIGQRVKHLSFGEGTILNVNGTGEKAKLTVSFDKGSLKKIIASYITRC